MEIAKPRDRVVFFLLPPAGAPATALPEPSLPLCASPSSPLPVPESRKTTPRGRRKKRLPSHKNDQQGAQGPLAAPGRPWATRWRGPRCFPWAVCVKGTERHREDPPTKGGSCVTASWLPQSHDEMNTSLQIPAEQGSRSCPQLSGAAQLTTTRWVKPLEERRYSMPVP